MTKEEYETEFKRLLQDEIAEVEKYNREHEHKEQLDSPVDVIHKKYGKLLRKLQKEYHG